MTDLEITRLCAEAMGYTPTPHPNRRSFKDLMWVANAGNWNPLADDAQAMALVKRFKADICWALDSSGNDGLWFVDIGDTTSEGYADRDADLNRAICLVVAKMQAAK